MTLTAGVLSVPLTRFPLATREQFQTFLESFNSYISILFDAFHPETETPSGSQIMQNIYDNALVFYSLFIDMREGRALFKMVDETWGLGPDCLQEGDIVVDLAGAHVHYALRPRGDKYLLLGQVYIGDAMTGERIDPKAELQHFCLV
jgi:hypothetical protein